MTKHYACTKPERIQVWRYDGHDDDELLNWLYESFQPAYIHNSKLYMETMDGMTCAELGDMVIQGVDGFYCMTWESFCDSYDLD